MTEPYNNSPKIKICGMTRPQNVEFAVELGVDAIGMILKADSPRLIDSDAAIRLRDVVPSSISLVGVFVNPSADDIDKAVETIGIDIVQLHGEESPEFAAALKIPVVKAIRARSAEFVKSQIEIFDSVCAYLIDPYVKGQHGGTGKQLDFNLWPTSEQRLVLAGGLSPENIVDSIDQCRPYAVDLNSGLETQPGVKDHTLMSQAVSLIRS
jgi:phosphoribosylanthranilate isomerase